MGRPSAKILLLCVAVFALATIIAWSVFEAMPHLEDEQANLFQAEVFASGRVTVSVPPNPESFFIPFVVNSAEGKRFGKYPPGYPLLLALGAAVGQPWLVNALAASLGIFGVYLLGRDLFDDDTGMLAAALAAVSPMFMLLAGTLLAHSTSIAALTLFAWAFVRARRAPALRRGLFALAAGGLLGWAAIIRPWTALAIGLPFALLGLWDVARSRGRALPFYLAMALAAASVCSLQALFNFAATGSPVTNTYRMWWDYDRVGFGPGHGRIEAGHTLLDGYRNAKLDLSEFPSALMGWPEPRGIALAWLPIALGLLWPPGCVRRSHIQPGEAAARSGLLSRVSCFLRGNSREWGLLLPAVVLVVAQMAYWARGSSLYGPRYYAEGMPFLWLIAARGLLKFAAGAWRRRAVKLALPLLVGWSIIFAFEPRILAGRGLFDISRQDANAIAAAQPHNALIFVHGDYWTFYASLSWLNSPTLDGDVIFAKDRGEVENARVIGNFPGRAVYFYDRSQRPALHRLPIERP